MHEAFSWRSAHNIHQTLKEICEPQNIKYNILREKKSPRPYSLGTCSTKALEETVEKMSKIAL